MNLQDFLVKYRGNHHVWYALGSGEMQNLFDEAVESWEELSEACRELLTIIGARDKLIAEFERTEPIKVAERNKLRAKIAELERKTNFCYCAYCGQEFPIVDPNDTTDVSNHIQTCPKHPMRDREQRIAELEARVKELELSLQSWKDAE